MQTGKSKLTLLTIVSICLFNITTAQVLAKQKVNDQKNVTAPVPPKGKSSSPNTTTSSKKMPGKKQDIKGGMMLPYTKENKNALSTSVWSDWIKSDEYPRNIQVRFAKITTNLLTMEVMNIGKVRIEGDFTANECADVYRDVAGYKKVILNPNSSIKLNYPIPSCKDSLGIRWWYRDIAIWSEIKEVLICTDRYVKSNYTSYKGILRYAVKNNMLLLEVSILEKPASSPSAYSDKFRGDIAASFCTNGYVLINGWQSIELEVGRTTIIQFEDKSGYCNGEKLFTWAWRNVYQRLE